MSDLRPWLADRRPAPPADLTSALEAVADGSAGETSLTEAGLERLNEAVLRPGRVRESAFRLLEADALLTYACEAALEADDPQAALRRILSAIGS